MDRLQGTVQIVCEPNRKTLKPAIALGMKGVADRGAKAAPAELRKYQAPEPQQFRSRDIPSQAVVR